MIGAGADEGPGPRALAWSWVTTGFRGTGVPTDPERLDGARGRDACEAGFAALTLSSSDNRYSRLPYLIQTIPAWTVAARCVFLGSTFASGSSRIWCVSTKPRKTDLPDSYNMERCFPGRQARREEPGTVGRRHGSACRCRPGNHN